MSAEAARINELEREVPDLKETNEIHVHPRFCSRSFKVHRCGIRATKS
jgi:hypothetical protein